MANRPFRSPAYIFGLLLLILGTAFYAIGYGCPYWRTVRFNDGSVSYGLWMTCSQSKEPQSSAECHSMDLFITVGWFRAVQALQTIGLIGLGISCFFGFVLNCCQASDPRHLSQSKMVEWLGFLGGLLAFIGMMVYVGKFNGGLGFFSWAFGFDLSGCLLAMVASIILFKTRNPPPENPTAAAGTTVLTQGQTRPPAGTTYGPSPYVVGTTPCQYPSAPAETYPLHSTRQGFSGYPPTSVSQGNSAGHLPIFTAQGYSGHSAPSAHPLGLSGNIAPNSRGGPYSAPPPSYEEVMAEGYSSPTDNKC